MIPVDQTIIDGSVGNCHSACVASLFELHIDQVPNLARFADDKWYEVYWHFCMAMGHKLSYVFANTAKKPMKDYDAIGGLYIAAVNSKTFEGKTHAVIVNGDGVVIHDPNPNKSYQGLDVLSDILSWSVLSKEGVSQ